MNIMSRAVNLHKWRPTRNKIKNLLDLLVLCISQVHVLVTLRLLILKDLPGLEVVRQRLLPDLGLLVGVLPGLPQLLHMALQELGTVGVLHQLLTLGDEVQDHLPLVLQAVQHLTEI
jgi:hypothetical protein